MEHNVVGYAPHYIFYRAFETSRACNFPKYVDIDGRDISRYQ
jgi:hypothetical protein